MDLPSGSLKRLRRGEEEEVAIGTVVIKPEKTGSENNRRCG